MRALALAAQSPIEREPLRLEHRPIPEPGPGEILVRVGACGVCRTDLHIVEGDLPLVRSPIVPGHQVVGKVEGRGSGAARFEAGERVGIAWLRRTCGACAYCTSARENLCERAESRARGCEVFVCTREASHRELARRLGATWAGDIREPMPVKTDGTIVFAPVGDLVPLALRNLARGGTLALAGIYMTSVPALEYERDLFYERSIRSVTANTRADGEELLAEAARIPIRPETTTLPLEEANRALQLLKRGAFAGAGVLLTGASSRVSSPHSL